MNWENGIRLRHLRCFLEIARGESVSGAALRLNVTQPAVSRALKELEEMLGVPLFDRVGRGIRLNAQGRVFQSHASASLLELMRARDRVQGGARLAARISVGALPTAATDLVPLAALGFRQDNPAAQLHVLSGPNWLLFNQLREGRLDLVVGRMPEAADLAGLTFEQLYSEDVVLVVRPGHPILSAADPIALLDSYDLILPPKGAVIALTVERYLSSIGLVGRRGPFETVSLPFGRRVVQNSDMLWFISRGVVAEELARGTLAAIAPGSALLAGPVGISLQETAAVSIERTSFIEHLRRVVRDSSGNDVAVFRHS